MTPLRSIVAALLLLVSSALAADVTINSFECDDSLPLTAADASLDCYPHDGYCMLGQDVTVKAKMTFNGVSSVTTNSVAYTMLKIGIDTGVSQIDSGLSLQQYSEPNPVNLCAWASSGYGYCPTDGTYTFKTTHTLPTWGDKDWFLTGEFFLAELLVYADEDATTLIADCKAHVSTRVTNPTTQSEYYDVPSAAMVGLIAGAVVAVAALCVCCGCWYMDHREIELKDEDLEARGGSFEMIQDDPVSMSRRKDYDYR
mmetsp:Transcript_1577/g.3757  ORF Transcript_1577/g.3757 Transcript_1577/m.3757 type:complete len:256 (+) Transcript_1577:117-884(+)